jgi:serine/threonine-protein kinase RsbT
MHGREIGLEADEVLKLETATSELAQNMLSHAGGGIVKIEQIATESRRGIRLTFQDEGLGIPDITLALKDGYTTKGGLGLGLPGTKRLVDDFKIDTKIDRGTRVVITKWMNE